MNVVFTILALAVFLLHWGFQKKRPRKTVSLLMGYLMLFGVGFSGLGAFVAHVFYADETAQLIGWGIGSPFQFEVGIANLALGALAILSFWLRGSFLFAAILGNVIWLFGDAVGHVRNWILTANTASGNTGIYFWWDVLMPIALIAVYILYSKRLSLN